MRYNKKRLLLTRGVQNGGLSNNLKVSTFYTAKSLLHWLFFLNLFNKLAFAYRVAKLKLFTSISATDAKTRNVSYNFSKLLIKLKTLSLNFDKIKILKYLGIAVTFIMIFGFIMFNANELTSKVPNGSSRYNWVGRLFYQKPELLFIFSFIIYLFLS